MFSPFCISDNFLPVIRVFVLIHVGWNQVHALIFIKTIEGFISLFAINIYCIKAFWCEELFCNGQTANHSSIFFQFCCLFLILEIYMLPKLLDSFQCPQCLYHCSNLFFKFFSEIWSRRLINLKMLIRKSCVHSRY